MLKKQKGTATLLITFMLWIVAVLMIINSASYSFMQQKTSSNQYQNNQSFEAADGGLEYGISFLNSNIATIYASASSGSINYTIPSQTQADGSTMSVTITNPQTNNYDLLTIRSTGKSNDTSSTKVVTQQVSGMSFEKVAIMTPQSLTTGGNTTINGGVDVGGTVSQGNNSSISSITQNDTSLANMSNDAIFTSIFAMDKNTMASRSTYYTSSSDISNWNNVSGTVWVNSDVKITSNVTIGSPTNPVLLIINGSFTGAGNAIFYGVLYVMGTTKVTGTINLNGGMVSEGAVTVSGNVTFNKTTVRNFTATSYAKVTGSWKDF